MCRQMSGSNTSILLRPLLIRNEVTEHRLDRVGSEPSRCQSARRRRSAPEPCSHRRSARRLGLERLEGLAGDDGLDAAPFEIGPDRFVAVAALRERCGAGRGETAVVEEAGSFHGCECFVAGGSSESRPLEAPCELIAREVTVPERASGESDGSCSPPLASQFPRACPIECDADAQARADDRVGGQRAPVAPVERDCDLVSGKLPE